VGWTKEALLPRVVGFAEDHVGLAVAGGSDLRQGSAARRALETTVVPVTFQRVQQPSVHYSVSATRALLDARRHARAAFLLQVYKR
jgi:hypothetical protein